MAWIVFSIFTVLTAYAVVVPQDNKGNKQTEKQKTEIKIKAEIIGIYTCLSLPRAWPLV